VSDVSFALATADDDAGIRRLLATNAIPGRIRIRYEREPDYFAGCATMGETQVLVARAGERVVGVACRAVRPMYINGERAAVGYLGQLRVDREFRGRWLVLRGFRMLHELHKQSPPRGYVTTIIEGNDEAEGVLVRRARGAMPRYRRIDRLITLAVAVPRGVGAGTVVPRAAPLPSPLPPPGERGLTPRSARPTNPLSPGGGRGLGRGAALATSSAETIAAFLEREGPRRNFFPVYDGTPADFTCVLRGGEIAAAAALWDQSAFKQTIVDGYDGLTRAARPLYNAAALLLRRPMLPKPGTMLRFAYASFFCVANDDPDAARELIGRLLAEARERGLDHLLLGFTESDPLLRVAQAFRHVAYPAGVYTVAWENDAGDQFHDQLDARPRYLDIASL
jgi:hypothetical protein